MLKDTKTADSIHSSKEAYYLDKLISELQERNRDKYLGENIEPYDAWHTSFYNRKADHINQLTKDTAHAVALAVIGEIEEAINNTYITDDQYQNCKGSYVTQRVGGQHIKSNLLTHLDTLKAKIKE